MSRAFFARLPIFGCAGFIVFLFLTVVWNFAVERDWPKLRIRSASPLAGVSHPKPAQWTLDAFLSGETQKAVSTNLGRSLLVFPISVRAKNQLVFSLFGHSAAPGVVIGRNGQLYQQSYIDEFCARDGAADPARLDAWASSLRRVQDAAAAAGKGFVYLIAPSKAARYSGDLPTDAACAARIGAMPEKLTPYRAALAGKGVRFVDGPALIDARRKDYAMPLFPRGGTHWNNLAAALALQEATRLAPTPVGVLAFDWAPAPEAVDTDRDLLDLLNLLWPDTSYPTPVVTRATPPQRCARAPRLLAMGDSFLEEILLAATLTPCPPQVDYWFYMRGENETGVDLLHYRRPPGDPSKGQRVPAVPADLVENLRGADLIVLEENETNIAATRQAGDLLAAFSRLP